MTGKPFIGGTPRARRASRTSYPGKRRTTRTRYILVATGTASHTRTTHQLRGRRGVTDRPDRGLVPPRREPQHADARRRPPALPEAGRSGPRLRPRDVRVDARRRRDRAALPQAAAPVALDRRPARLGRGRAVRHRPPHPAQRSAQPRADPRAARPEQPTARHPARLGAPDVGGARHRRPARRPGGALHEDPPLPGRRHLGHATGAEHASATTPTCATCRRRGTPGPAAAGPGRSAARRPAWPRSRRRHCARRWGSPPRPPGCRVR